MADTRRPKRATPEQLQIRRDLRSSSDAGAPPRRRRNRLIDALSGGRGSITPEDAAQLRGNRRNRRGI
jgi:hypothetical protein